MKILRKTITLALVIVIMSANITTFKTLASSNMKFNSRREKNIAVLLYNFEDLFMLQLKKGFEDVQKENEGKVKFTFYDGKNSILVQNETVDSVLQSNVDLFILGLADTKQNVVENFLVKLKQNDVPAVFFDIPAEVVSKVSRIYNKAAFLYSISQHEGALEGKIIVDEWNANKQNIDKNNDDILQYVLIEGPPYNERVIERSKDSISEIKNSGIKTEELAQVSANWSENEAKDAIKNLFLRYGNKIEAIIANNDAMAIGAIKALQEYGYNTGDKLKYIHVVGIDNIPKAKDLIDKGFMTGTVSQEPKILAEAIYKVGLNLINNENITENTDYKEENGLITIQIPFQIYKGKTKAQ